MHFLNENNIQLNVLKYVNKLMGPYFLKLKTGHLSIDFFQLDL